MANDGYLDGEDLWVIGGGEGEEVGSWSVPAQPIHRLHHACALLCCAVMCCDML